MVRSCLNSSNKQENLKINQTGGVQEDLYSKASNVKSNNKYIAGTQ